MTRHHSLKDYVPLIFFQFYLFGSVLLFAFGPWQWIVEDKWTLYGFLLGAQFMIALGYIAGVWRISPENEPHTEPAITFTWFRLSLAFNILLAVPMAWARTNSWFPDIFTGFQNLGTVYLENVIRLSKSGPHVYVEYARIFLSVFIFSLVPLTVIYWRRISGFERFLAAVTIAWYIAIFIAVGQNKGLADALATWAILIVAGYLFDRIPLRSIAVKLPLAYIVAFTVFFSYFGLTQLQRTGGAIPEQAGTLVWLAPDKTEVRDDCGDQLTVISGKCPVDRFAGGAHEKGEDRPDPITRIAAYPDHLVARLAPDFVRNVYESFTRYLGQGYQALAFSFDISHPSTLGFGNSMFLARNADRVLNTNFFECKSLPALLEETTGWSRMMQWHSIYVWLASDVGFIGTLLVMAGIGFLLARSWVQTIYTGDPIWATMLYLMLIMFFYIPGNNQVFQIGETTVGFFGLLTIIFIRWLLKRFPGFAFWRIEGRNNVG